MRRALIAVLVLVLIVAAVLTAVLAFRGDGDESSQEAIRVTPPSSRYHSYGIVEGSTAQPLARLPGITVVGSGEVEVKPDLALVHLTVGSGSRFDSSEGSVQLIDEQELGPVVEALTDAGVDKDDLYVDTFSGSSFGSDQGSAVIAFKWPRPQEVKKILATAQRAIRKETAFNLQDVSIVFMRHDCDGPEQKAMRAALADARKRAERLASLSDAKLGRLIAVSEATSGGAQSPFVAQRCGAEDLLAPGLFEYQTAAATADETTVTVTLEVTFAVER
jgi:uncharacterized protein YggE